MIKLYISFFAFLFFCASLQGQDLFVKNANIIDVSTGKLIKGQDIRVKDGIIAEIGPSLKKQDTEELIEAKGKYVIPGLVDAHIHMFQSGSLYARPDIIDLTEIRPYVDERLRTYQMAEDMLNRYTSIGITSVIDLGGPIYQFDLRDSLNKKVNSSTVFTTGPLISSYLPKELMVNYPPIIKVDSIASALEIVQQQHELGADFIKIWYIALTPQDAIDFYPIVEAVCKESKRLGLPVAIHATTLATAKFALKAGAKFLAHSVKDVEVDDEFLDLLKKAKAIYCPTLQVSKQYDNVILDEFTFTDYDFAIANPTVLQTLMDVRFIENNEDLNYYTERRSAIHELNRKQDSIQSANMEKLIVAGLPIALGTDAGNVGSFHASSFYKELELFKQAGMSEIELLKSMTIYPAIAINKHDQIGTISRNRRADLLVLNANPLEEIAAVKDIHTIIKGGEKVDASSLIETTAESIVQQQMNGYNGHSLEAFLSPYAEDVRMYDFPDKLTIEGKDQMRQEYQFVNDIKDLHSQLKNRIVKGDTIIDYLDVTVDKEKPTIQVIAIYKIRNQKIQEVYFIN